MAKLLAVHPALFVAFQIGMVYLVKQYWDDLPEATKAPFNVVNCIPGAWNLGQL